MQVEAIDFIKFDAEDKNIALGENYDYTRPSNDGTISAWREYAITLEDRIIREDKILQEMSDELKHLSLGCKAIHTTRNVRNI